MPGGTLNLKIQRSATYAFAALGLLLTLLIGGLLFFHYRTLYQRWVDAWLKSFPANVRPDLVETDSLPITSKVRLMREAGMLSFLKVYNRTGDTLAGFGEDPKNLAVHVDITDEMGQKWGSFAYLIDNYVVQRQFWIAMAMALALIVLATFTLRLYFDRTLRRQLSGFELFILKLEQLGQRISTEENIKGLLFSAGHPSERVGTEEEQRIGTVIDSLIEAIKLFHEHAVRAQVEVERLEIFKKIGAQVAHDIQSPLAALEVMVATLPELEESQGLLAKKAFARLRDIAKQWRTAPLATINNAYAGGDDRDQESVALLSDLIESIISEKRLEYQQRMDLVILADTINCRECFAHVNANEFKRVISNLVNNGVEAIRGAGQVTVRLSERETHLVAISVDDTGHGIPKAIRPHLGKRGFSYGKQGTGSGTGLGLAHAIEMATQWGGHVDIDSVEGQGTSVALVIPRADAPSWCASSIRVPSEGKIIIADDDPAILTLWQSRFAPFGAELKLLCFSRLSQLVEYLAEAYSGGPVLYLLDHEFAGEQRTGLDIIEQHGLAAKSVLVTGRFDDTVIRSRCLCLGLQVLPKSLVGYVTLSPP